VSRQFQYLFIVVSVFRERELSFACELPNSTSPSVLEVISEKLREIYSYYREMGQANED
jgi:hypothetical protein